LPPYTYIYALAVPVLESVIALVVAIFAPGFRLPKFMAVVPSEIVHVADEMVITALFAEFTVTGVLALSVTITLATTVLPISALGIVHANELLVALTPV